jgi:hypothetical protein
VSTGSAGGITANSATVNGTINPNGLDSSYVFQYGPTASYGSTSGTYGVGSGTSTLSINANLPSLSANTTYHYRIVGSNNAGSNNGGDATFTTTH